LNNVDKKSPGFAAKFLQSSHLIWRKNMRPQHAGCNEITAQDLLASVRPFIAPTRWIVIANPADRAGGIPVEGKMIGYEI
jgi:hypothetical protein